MKNPTWLQQSIFYHIYPLGLLGCPPTNPTQSPAKPALLQLIPWLDHLQTLGANALYLGPVFESETHGYDTRDYFQVDHRLGSNQDLQTVVKAAHTRGIRVILDGVFNHSGRSFWAFQDLVQHGQNSMLQSWYENVRFDQRSPLGDAFNYQTWNGHHSLPKFNLSNQQVRDHLLQAVQFWVETFEIDGLRLDAADHVQVDFWQELRSQISSTHPDFWLMGELVHGDYNHWVNDNSLHSATNYEAYKGLYSSFNDHNFFEIAYTLNRQFGVGGLYRELSLYNFLDNHDVNRIASQLSQSAHLYPLYGLLFCMPGIPSVYYGSEWGISGERKPNSDAELRPALELEVMLQHAPHPALIATLQKFSSLRREYTALQNGAYRQALVQPEQFAFWRESDHQCVLVIVNAASQAVRLPKIPIPQGYSRYFDPLCQDTATHIEGNQLELEISANWIKVLVFEN